jgi:hypothetical protein
MKINVHIERVILDGVPADHPRLLRRALEKELTERLAGGGLSPEFRRGGAVPYVGGGAIEIGKERSGTKLGTQLGGAVYRGIGGRK